MSVLSSPIDSMSEAESPGSSQNESSISSEDEVTISSESAAAAADTDSSGYGQPTATGLSKKRKSETSAGHKPKKRYNDQYRQLLNDTINTAAGRSHSDESERPRPSQHGVSWWTGDEKAIMFDVLAKKGENEISAIAAAIGTKSEMEVRVYLLMLRKASEEKLRQRGADRLSLVDIPAAAEIGADCCSVLDQHAQSLSSLQQTHEEKVERQKHAELWLLTHDIANWVEGHLEDESLEGADIRERLPAVSLLNLPKWLQLSERIFMNSASPREGESWQVVGKGRDTPSIMNTAFSDFHTLAVSITKRLIQSSLFYAKSRLRATDSSRYRYRPVVRAKDVKVATQVLGMKATAHEFWTRVPRRCNLQVYRGKQRARFLDYDQVERFLRQEEVEEQHSDGQTERLVDSLTEHESDDDIAPALAEETTSEDSEYDDACRPSDLSGSQDLNGIEDDDQIPTESEWASKHDRAQRKLEREEDGYAEILDKQVSQAEEKRIWEMLDESPTSAVKPEIPELPKKPGFRGKTTASLVHWKDKIEFWSEWEVFTSPVPRNRFEREGERDRLLDLQGVESLRSNSRHGQERTGSAEDEGLEAESARIDPGIEPTTEYTSFDNASQDAENSSDASQGRSCRVNPVAPRSELPADLHREDTSLSRGSDDEDRSGIELDGEADDHVHEHSNDEVRSDGEDRPVSTAGSELPSMSSSSAHSRHQSSSSAASRTQG